MVATHPICAGLVSRFKEETGEDLPLITCVTDLSTHNEWLHRGTDCYLVGSPEIRDRLAAKGVEEERILGHRYPGEGGIPASRPPPGRGESAAFSSWAADWDCCPGRTGSTRP